MILTPFMQLIDTVGVVAGDVSAHKTTCVTNAYVIEHSHLMMCVLINGNMNACSKFTCECNIACGQYHTNYTKLNQL